MTLTFYNVDLPQITIEISHIHVTEDMMAYAPLVGPPCRVVLHSGNHLWETEHDGLFDSFSVS